MKLYIPSSFRFVTDPPIDTHVMTLEDGLILQDVMEHFEDFEELRKVVNRQFARRETVGIYDKSIEDLFDEDKLPKGSLRQTFNAIVNVFIEHADQREDGHEGEIEDRLNRDMMIARIADQFAVTPRTAKSKLDAIEQAGYIKNEYGNTVFPHKLRKGVR